MSTEKIKYLFCLYLLTEENNKTETITVFIDKKLVGKMPKSTPLFLFKLTNITKIS